MDHRRQVESAQEVRNAARRAGVVLTAPSEVRASRIWEREKGDLSQVLKETLARDDRDHKRYLKLYGIDNEQYDFADMIIETENYSPEEICRMIVQRVEKLG